MFNIKIEGTENVIEFLKMPVVGLKVTITYKFGLSKIKGAILKNDKDWITIQIPNDTFTIVKDAIFSLELKKSDYIWINNLNKKIDNKLVEKENHIKMGFGFLKTMELERELIDKELIRLQQENELLAIGGIELLEFYRENDIPFNILKESILGGITIEDIKEAGIKMEDKDIYLDKNLGIRKDYLYEIDTKSVGCVLGEILNFDYSKYVVKQYKANGEFNHYIIKGSDILELHPYMTIEKFNEKVKSR